MHLLPRPRLALHLPCWALLAALTPALASAATLQVGPDKQYKTVNSAVAVAQSGDTIEVDAGEYVDDISSIKVNNLTIRGVGGARAHLKATVPPPNKKGIFVVEAGVGPVTFEHLEISGSRISEGDGNNGAGIRAQGTDVTIRDCYIHDNQNGILTNATSVTVEFSELAYNGEAGYEHNIYVGEGPKFVFRGNYSHHSVHGYTLKSRAFENHIVYNRLMEEGDGNGSGLIDLPQGGLTYITGNLIQKGPNADNKTRIVLYKGEGNTNPDLRLFVSHNTFVNDGSPGSTFVDIKAATEVTLGNNLYVGMGTPFALADVNIPLTDLGNMQTDAAGLVNMAGYDYHLLPDSIAIDAGVALAAELMPDSQYVHPSQVEARPVVGAPDLGAYEFGEGAMTTGGESGSTGDTGADGTAADTGADSGATASTAGTEAGDTGGTAGETAGETGGDSLTSDTPPTTDGPTTDGPTTDGPTAATASTGTVDTETTGSNPADGDSGCSCRSDRDAGAGWTLLTALGLLIARRRGARRIAD